MLKGPAPSHRERWLQFKVECRERLKVVEDKQRQRRLRLLIKKLNKVRRKQAQKIDILCNDLIAAQREFIRRLGTISFVANFCESIVGTTDLNNLLSTAVKLIKAEIGRTNISFFIYQGTEQGTEAVQVHMFQSSDETALDSGEIQEPGPGQLESCFGPELVENICRSNKVCRLHDMFAAGLQCNLAELNKVSAVTIPLGQFGSSLGFMLVYRSSQDRIVTEDIQRITAITHGLSRAISSCQALSKAGSNS